jgi:hypothetical protein
VADEKDLRVFVSETKRLNGLLDLRRRRFKVGIDEDVALGRDDEVRGEILRTDVIEVAGNSEGREGLDPGRVRFGERVLLGRQSKGRYDGDEKNDEVRPSSFPTHSTEDVEWMGHPRFLYIQWLKIHPASRQDEGRPKCKFCHWDSDELVAV